MDASSEQPKKLKKPKTPAQKRHLEKFAATFEVEDLTSLEFPRAVLSKYPDLEVTCDYVNQIYQRFAGLAETIDNGNYPKKFALRMRKKLRREVAPQLLLALKFLNNFTIDWLTPREKRTQGLARWVALVVSESKKYKAHEPVYSLLLPYILAGNPIGGASAAHINEAQKRRAEFKELELACTSTAFGLDSESLFKYLDHSVWGDAKLQAQVVIKKLRGIQKKLRTAKQEWQMIERYYRAEQAKYANSAEWRESLQEIVKYDRVRRHLEKIDELLEEAAITMTAQELVAVVAGLQL